MNENTVIIIQGRSVSPAFIDLVNELTDHFVIGEDNKSIKDDLFELLGYIAINAYRKQLDHDFIRITSAAFYLYRFADKIEKVKIESLNPNNEGSSMKHN